MIGDHRKPAPKKADPIVACNFCDHDSRAEDIVLIARDIDTAICDECIWRCVAALLDKKFHIRARPLFEGGSGNGD